MPGINAQALLKAHESLRTNKLYARLIPYGAISQRSFEKLKLAWKWSSFA
jgi:hypothetical protein